jgi:hypothetical protein
MIDICYFWVDLAISSYYKKKMCIKANTCSLFDTEITYEKKR